MPNSTRWKRKQNKTWHLLLCMSCITEGLCPFQIGIGFKRSGEIGKGGVEKRESSSTVGGAMGEGGVRL